MAETELARIRELAEKSGWNAVHQDDLSEIVQKRHGRIYQTPEPPAEPPPVCVYCNAVWTPEMMELVEESGYCETCSDAEQVTEIFCSSCERLVYRKEGW